MHTGLNIGILLFMTTVIAFGVFLPMLGILKERLDRSQLFVLSLPMSAGAVLVAKVRAALIAFLVPWLRSRRRRGVVAVTRPADRTADLPFFVGDDEPSSSPTSACCWRWS